MNRKYALAIFFYLTCFCLEAQSIKTFNVKGKVFDAVTRKPLKNILILVKNKNTNSFSDSTGTFSIPVSFGDKLLAGNVAYKKDSVIINRIDVGKGKPFIFILSPNVFTLSEVEVFKKKFTPYYDPVWPNPFNEKPARLLSGSVSEGIGITLSINYFYQRWSHKWINQRKLYKLVEHDHLEWELKNRLDKSLILEATGVDTAYIDEFVKTVSLSQSFIRDASDYEFVVEVKKKYADFLDARE